MKRESKKPAPVAATAPKPQIQTIELDFPPPEHLLELAMGEPDRKLLGEYAQTISVLRHEKKFTFREIAEWLTENGVPADHNSVYRTFTKHMTPDEVLEMDSIAAQEEQEENQ